MTVDLRIAIGGEIRNVWFTCRSFEVVGGFSGRLKFWQAPKHPQGESVLDTMKRNNVSHLFEVDEYKILGGGTYLNLEVNCKDVHSMRIED